MHPDIKHRDRLCVSRIYCPVIDRTQHSEICGLLAVHCYPADSWNHFYAVAPELIWKWRHRSKAKVGHRSGAGKFFLGRVPPLLGSKSTISRFGERFRDGQYSLVSFFLVCCSPAHGAPPRAQPFVKVGGTCPRVPWSRRHCFYGDYLFHILHQCFQEWISLRTDRPAREVTDRELVCLRIVR